MNWEKMRKLNIKKSIINKDSLSKDINADFPLNKK